MKEVRLTRTGKRPLAFNGEIIAKCSTQNVSGPNQNRWQKCEVYKTSADTKGGKFVVGVGRITCWQGEADHYSVDVFDTLEGVMEHIEKELPELAPEMAKELGVVETL